MLHWAQLKTQFAWKIVLVWSSTKYHFIKVHHTFMSNVVFDFKSFFPLYLLSMHRREFVREASYFPEKQNSHQKLRPSQSKVPFYLIPSILVPCSHLIPQTVVTIFSPHSHITASLFFTSLLHSQIFMVRAWKYRILCLPSTCYCSQYLSQSHLAVTCCAECAGI